MNELVTFHNDFNKIRLGHSRSVELDIFFSILYKIKNNGSNKITLSFDELKKISNYKKTADSQFIYNLKEIHDNLLKLNYFSGEIRKGVYFGATFFTYYFIDENERTVSIGINDVLSYLINELTKNFTKLELKQITSLSSKYAKHIFKNLKQFDNNEKICFWEISMEEFKENLKIPMSYKMSDINKQILIPALKELCPLFPELKLVKKKKGRKIDKLRFEWMSKKYFEEEQKRIEEEKAKQEQTSREKIIEAPAKVEIEKTLSERIQERIQILLKMKSDKEAMIRGFSNPDSKFSKNFIKNFEKQKVEIEKRFLFFSNALFNLNNLNDEELAEVEQMLAEESLTVK